MAQSAALRSRHFVLPDHGYVERWQDWPYSNAEQYLEEVGRETAERRWRAFPLLDYGRDWDPPEL